MNKSERREAEVHIILENFEKRGNLEGGEVEKGSSKKRKAREGHFKL